MLVLVVAVVVGEVLTGSVPGWLLVIDVVVGLVGSVLLVAGARGGRIRPTLVLVAVSALSPAATPLV